MTATFYERALARMTRGMAVIGLAGALAALLWRGWQAGIAFALGAAASYWNFKWLHEAVEGLGPAARPTRKRVIVWLLVRYLAAGAGAYVIVKVFGMNAIAAVLGLFVPVAAVIAEIIYELTQWNTNSG